MKESSQRRNENSSSSFFAVSMSRVPAPDRDDFWKFIRYLLYFFFNVSKVLTADPIKKKEKKSEGKYSESRLQCLILEKNLQITLKCFSHKLILQTKPIKSVSKYTKASPRGFTNFLELSYGGVYFQVLQIH